MLPIDFQAKSMVPMYTVDVWFTFYKENQETKKADKANKATW